MRSDAKNLQAITEGIKEHNRSCDSPAVAVLMNPFEVERLDWDEVMGVPIVADGKIGTGRFRVICERDSVEREERVVDAVSVEVEVSA